MKVNTLLKAKSLVKDFPGVRALDNVDFELNEGEIHAILGENGAGKSTLIKILGGVYKPDVGEVWVDGKPVTIDSPRHAQLLGIRVIHQELNLLPLLSVEENIFLGNLPKRISGVIDWKQVRLKAQDILSQFNSSIDPEVKAGSLNPGEQQLVEIAQALTSEVRVLIMDEPSAALSSAETKNLFLLIKKMSREGIGIIYITHRIGEVFEIADRVTVLRDGENIGCVNVMETNTSQLVEMMVGRTLKEMYPRNRGELGEVVLEVRNLTSNKLKNINLTVRKGEVVGVYGLLGSGRSQLANALFGVAPVTSGDILINNQKGDIHSPHLAKKLGLGYVPAERKTEAIILPLSLRKNLTVSSLEKYLRNFIFIDENKERMSCDRWIDALNIRASSQDANINSLSGGNQQKVIFTRWLDTKARILILNEPTRGVDVGAKVEIYKLIDDLCHQGHAILMFSSEMPELLSIADRIMVMSGGQITGEYSHSDATQEKLMKSAIAAY